MDIAEAEKDEGAGMKVYIERTAVMNVLEQYYPGVNERLYIVKDITSLPAADVAPVRHGDGRNTMGPIMGSTTVPSAKGKLSITRKMEVIEILSGWCPNCGARMDKEDNYVRND